MKCLFVSIAYWNRKERPLPLGKDDSVHDGYHGKVSRSPHMDYRWVRFIISCIVDDLIN